MTSTIGYARNRLFAVLGLALLTGCSGMQPTPMMPTYPAQIGGRGGVSMEADSLCRQQAYQAADKARQDNVNKEVAFTAIGTLAGAVIGNQIQAPGRHGPPPRGPRGPGGPGRPGRPSTHDMAGAGALAGAATGAALSQGALQNPQQVYDIYYNNCIERYRAYR